MMQGGMHSATIPKTTPTMMPTNGAGNVLLDSSPSSAGDKVLVGLAGAKGGGLVVIIVVIIVG